jgi:hypothetical protein
MNLTPLIYVGAVFLLFLVGYGAASGQTTSTWQASFFVLMAMSMVFLVADRQRPT